MATDGDFFILDSYPGDAAAGACYLTLADRGEIIEDRPDGPVVRAERVVVTPREVGFEGRICLSERIVRHLAHLLGMVDDWRVDAVKAHNAALRDEAQSLSHTLAKAWQTIELLSSLSIDPPEQVWVALDGSEHASKRAALDRCAQLLRLESVAVADLRPITVLEAPVPEPDRQEVTP